MLPGRFPSPTPSRETTPVEICSSVSKFEDVGRRVSQAGAPSRPKSSDFTAASYLRKRPQFTDAQSDPEIRFRASFDLPPSDRPSLLSSPSPNANRHTQDRRRVSDPLHSRPQSSVHKTQHKRQRLSDIPQYNTRAFQTPYYNTASHLPSTPRQHANLSSEYHQTTHTPSPNERPMDSKGYTKAEPDFEHGQWSNQEPKRTRSPAAPKTARSIHDKLRSKLLENLTFSDTSGVIYILYDPLRPELGYKIGSTARANYEQRIDEHRRNCKFEPVVVYVSPCETEYCIRTERLIQIDLENHCRHWQCDKHKATSTTHEEWFQVTRMLAIRTVKKWEDFMRHGKPYNWKGKLRSVWRHVLHKRWLTFSAEISLTHEVRREHWTLILALPTAVDYMETYWKILNDVLTRVYETSSRTWLYLKAFFWQLTTLVYGLFMFAICRSTVAFAAFALLLVCASLSILSHLPLSPSRKRARRLA
ncbi:uncharacterized protein K460DRAFT_368276 [Cucurbitaria berberidis CBS 394.84]|uniref:Bacteriophage T5 Orf172 DNA-binding domain-containing protein n=1 Tax=Cucurbitaria berberidis CBS 394.84 TaxID=1168544 RepID=A0A9P4GCJ1_9PLEO|nr:uncharacterized protein K460DRAFT_368276 [Cucurbitaria berberidis CBS 394.84]KAF1843378.1 hypothetical protein K460DRAFT_368276 [Cucurbitaria berberidis CBS 394.84]